VEQSLYLLARTVIANEFQGKPTRVRDCSLMCRNPINLGNLDNSVIAKSEDQLHVMCGSFSTVDNKLSPGFLDYDPCSRQNTQILHLVQYNKF